MTIEKIKNDNALTVSVSGRLDTTTAPELLDTLDEILDGINSLVLDFKNLEYISSAGLRVLLQTQKTMAKRGGMVIRNVNETISEVFDVTGFMDILTVEK